MHQGTKLTKTWVLGSSPFSAKLWKVKQQHRVLGRTHLQTGAGPKENSRQGRGAEYVQWPVKPLVQGVMQCAVGRHWWCRDAGARDARGEDKRDIGLPWSKKREGEGRSLRLGKAPPGRKLSTLFLIRTPSAASWSAMGREEEPSRVCGLWLGRRCRHLSLNGATRSRERWTESVRTPLWPPFRHHSGLLPCVLGCNLDGPDGNAHVKVPRWPYPGFLYEQPLLVGRTGGCVQSGASGHLELVLFVFVVKLLLADCFSDSLLKAPDVFVQIIRGDLGVFIGKGFACRNQELGPALRCRNPLWNT